MTGSALLDCHVLKGFGIYMIGILDSLSNVVEALCGHSSCNLDMQSLLDNIKGIESTFFLFRHLTKLPHPNTIYRYIGPGVGSGYWRLSCESGRRRTEFFIDGTVAKEGTGTARGDGYSECGKAGTVAIGDRNRGEEYSWDIAEDWDSKRGYYVCIGRGGCGSTS